MSQIKIIIGSTRPSRFGVQPAELVHRLATEHTDHTFEIVDLKDSNLPLLDAPAPPSTLNSEYPNPNVRAWSKIVDEADGFIFVTPEYNHGVPAALKNAIDSLAPEWENKPAAFVSYGADAGGVRAQEAFRPTLAWLGMHDIKEFASIANYWQFLDKTGTFQPTDKHIEDIKRVISRIGFWADIFKDARAKLAAAS